MYGVNPVCNNSLAGPGARGRGSDEARHVDTVLVLPIDRPARAVGVNSLFGYDPRDLKGDAFDLYPAFGHMYALLLWLTKVRRVGNARPLADTPRSVLPVALALAGRGAYEVSISQLRYAYEAVISFLYFRDHRREYELALEGNDVWGQMRPSAVISFLKRLPEYRKGIGIQQLGACESLYGDLSMCSHPRVVNPSKYLSECQLEEKQHRKFNQAMRNLASAAVGLLALSDHELYEAGSEVDRALMRAPVSRDVWKRISTIS